MDSTFEKTLEGMSASFAKMAESNSNLAVAMSGKSSSGGKYRSPTGKLRKKKGGGKSTGVFQQEAERTSR